MFRRQKHIKQKEQGAALLVFVIVLLFSITWLTFTLSKMGRFSQKITANEYRTEQAFEAAEAGIEYGILYLERNRTAIVVDANSDGYIDSYTNASISNVTLANGSKYTVSYRNPTVNNFSLIQISSIGTSADNTASREIHQQVYYTPLLMTYGNYPMVGHGNVTLAGSTQIVNTQNNATIQAGGTITINGSAKTVISSGTSSTASSLKTDVNQNSGTISSLSSDSFFSTYFGSSAAMVKSAANYVYQNASNANYDTVLNGMQNTVVWIEQTAGSTATIDSTTVVGSASKPVLLIVNGDLRIQGSAIINGYVYVTGSVQTTGSASINGALVVGGNFVDAGNFTITFNTTILNNLQKNLGTYGKVSGSWNDLKL